MAAAVRAIATIVGAYLLASCAHRSVAFSELKAAQEGERVSVQGHLVTFSGAYELAYLCTTPRTERVDGSCIDLVRRDARPVRPPANLIGTCVTVYGHFQGYGPDVVTLGNLVSEVGLIEVDRLAPCGQWD